MEPKTQMVTTEASAPRISARWYPNVIESVDFFLDTYIAIAIDTLQPRLSASVQHPS